LFGGKVGKGRANVLEGLVVWREDSDVWGIVGRVEKVGCVEGTAEGGEACSGEGVCGSFGEDQQAVNYMDDTSGEVYILVRVSRVGLMVRGQKGSWKIRKVFQAHVTS
jgi:hypothetical protein